MALFDRKIAHPSRTLHANDDVRMFWRHLDANALLDHTSGWVNVKSYGAVGDGVTDDAPAIQRAHDTLGVRGGIIALPTPPGTGTYRVSTSLTLTKPVILLGDSRCEITKSSTLDGPALILAAAGITVRDLHIGAQAGSGGDGIVVLHKNCALRNLQVYLQARDGVRIGPDGTFAAPDGSQAEGTIIEGVVSSFNGRHGFYVHDAVNSPAEAWDTKLIACSADENGVDGFRVDDGQQTHLFGCGTTGNAGYGLNLGPGLSSPTSLHTVVVGGSWQDALGQLNALGGINIAENTREVYLNIASNSWVTAHAATAGSVGYGGGRYFGSGAPADGNGNDGDFYFRSDTPGTPNQRIYVKAAGSWTGVL